jgi:hypothetical protein
MKEAIAQNIMLMTRNTVLSFCLTGGSVSSVSTLHSFLEILTGANTATTYLASILQPIAYFNILNKAGAVKSAASHKLACDGGET